MSLNLNALNHTMMGRKTVRPRGVSKLGEAPTPTPLRKRLKTQVNAVYHPSPLEFNEKSFVATFQKWGTGGPAIYDVKVSRDSIVRHNRHVI